MLWVLLVIGIPILALLALWLIGERGRLILPSTRAAMKDMDPRQSFVDSIHAYIYGRWSNQYVRFLVKFSLPRMRAETKKKWADTYHAKILTPELAQSIITLDHDINCDLEQIIPYPAARDLILDGPPQVAAYECPCRSTRKNPCQPTQVCLIVGNTDFSLEHNPHSTRLLTQAEALELLEAEHERGHVHSAYFKDVLGHRFYQICNCCTCCCVGVEANMRYDVPMLLSSGYVAQVEESKCVGCGLCEKACPFKAITVHDDVAVIDWEKCMGCTVCVVKCKKESLRMVRDDRKGIPLDVRKIGFPPVTGG